MKQVARRTFVTVTVTFFVHHEAVEGVIREER